MANPTAASEGTRGRRLAARIALALAGAILVVLVLAQLVLPGIGERAIENRLTEHGGVAEVSLHASPAARLLWGDGDRLAVDARGLELDLTDDVRAFENLEPFDEVEIAIADSKAGPIAIETFVLRRSGDAPYLLDGRASTSASGLARYAADQAGLPGAGVIETAIGLTGIGAARIPVEIDMELVAEDGRVRVTGGGGTVAGIPTGPLAELITAAIVVRL